MQGKEAHAAEAKSANPSDCKQDFAFSLLSPTPRMGKFDLFISLFCNVLIRHQNKESMKKYLVQIR